MTLGALPAASASNDPMQVLITNMPTKEAYQDFIDTYEEFQQKAEMAQQERKERREQNVKTKEQKYHDKVFKMLAKINDLLDESWRDLALSFRYRTDNERKRIDSYHSSCFTTLFATIFCANMCILHSSAKLQKLKRLPRLSMISVFKS